MYVRRTRFQICTCLVASFVVAEVGFAQTRSRDGVWEVTRSDESSLKAYLDNTAPGAVRAHMNRTRLLELLSGAPKEGRDGTKPVVTLPIATKERETFIPFEIEESPMVVDGSEGERYRSYRGTGVEDPSITTRFDVSPEGLNGIVLTGTDTYFIAPFPFERLKTRESEERLRGMHFTFASSALDITGRNEACETTRDGRRAAKRQQNKPGPALEKNQFEERTYRIAISATSDYVKFHHDLQPQLSEVDAAYQAISTTMNLVRAVYEREFGIHFVLPTKEKKLIFADPKKDPFSGKTVDGMLAENQRVVDEIIKTANYDLAHVFATRGAGKAEIQCVCDPVWKARGLTGLEDATANTYFAVDYLAHEIGHQFGAEHTFNGTKGACGSGRIDTNAFEPGSGTTIMGYAGICEDQDLAKRSQHYFHAASLGQITAAFPVTGTCAKVKVVRNSAPSVQVTGAYSVPGGGTPYSLSAKASDPDDPRPTFVWEEYYPSSFTPAWTPVPDDGTNDEPWPVIASTATGTEGFLHHVPGATAFRDIPIKPRKVNVRVTARDGRGRYGSGDIVLTIAGSERFEITLPKLDSVWTKTGTHEIRWSVAKTDLAPVACKELKLRLSVDDGQTFPHELIANTANDGTVEVQLPPQVPKSNTARVRLDAIGNVFFAVSPRFTIAEDAAALTTTPNTGLSSKRDS